VPGAESLTSKHPSELRDAPIPTPSRVSLSRVDHFFDLDEAHGVFSLVVVIVVPDIEFSCVLLQTSMLKISHRRIEGDCLRRAENSITCSGVEPVLLVVRGRRSLAESEES
jgi:hypothetical protein